MYKIKQFEATHIFAYEHTSGTWCINGSITTTSWRTCHREQRIFSNIPVSFQVLVWCDYRSITGKGMCTLLRHTISVLAENFKIPQRVGLSANIDLSACKGKICPTNTGCLWNTNDAVASTCCRQTEPHAWAEQQENREKWHEIRQRQRGRRRGGGGGGGAENIGRQTSKMKRGEGGGMKRMTMHEKWKQWMCGKG